MLIGALRVVARVALCAWDNHRARPGADTVGRERKAGLPDAGGLLGWVVLAGAIVAACCAVESEAA